MRNSRRGKGAPLRGVEKSKRLLRPGDQGDSTSEIIKVIEYYAETMVVCSDRNDKFKYLIFQHDSRGLSGQVPLSRLLATFRAFCVRYLR